MVLLKVSVRPLAVGLYDVEVILDSGLIAELCEALAEKLLPIIQSIGCWIVRCLNDVGF